MARPVITFLTDFGPSAPAVCRGVMFGIAPDANIIDINHQVPRFSIRDGAASLVFALPHMPVGTHVAVVDPGVGTARLPVALKVARGDVLIGPDNGLLIEAAERLGGIVEARAIENRDLWLPVVSSSFHGRDIFAPTAAHVAMGVPFERVGPVVPDRRPRPARPSEAGRSRRAAGDADRPRDDLRQRDVRRQAAGPRRGDRGAGCGPPAPPDVRRRRGSGGGRRGHRLGASPSAASPSARPS